MPPWKKVKLGDACLKIGSGATPRGGESSYISNGISLVRSQNVIDYAFSMRGLAHITENQSNELANVELKQNDILVNITGDSVARVCQIPDSILPARVNQHVAILRANQTILNSAYLKYYLLQPISKQNLLTLASSGATRNALTKWMLEDFEIQISDLPTQTHIASILSAFDDKIELNRQMNNTLEQMAQALYKKYFITGIDPNNLPDGWKWGKVRDIFNISIGRTPPRNQHEWFTTDPHDIKWISIKDMGNIGPFIIQSSEFLTESAVNKFNIPVIPIDTIILSFKLTMGRVSITTENMLSNEAIAHFIPKSDTFLPKEFTYLYLKNFDYNSLGNTSSIATAVNSQTIKEMDFLIPNKKVVVSFNSSISKLFSKILQNTLEIRILEQTRNILLPKLMSGEISTDPLPLIESRETIIA